MLFCDSFEEMLHLLSSSTADVGLPGFIAGPSMSWRKGRTAAGLMACHRKLTPEGTDFSPPPRGIALNRRQPDPRQDPPSGLQPQDGGAVGDRGGSERASAQPTSHRPSSAPSRTPPPRSPSVSAQMSRMPRSSTGPEVALRRSLLVTAMTHLWHPTGNSLAGGSLDLGEGDQPLRQPGHQPELSQDDHRRVQACSGLLRTPLGMEQLA